MKEEEEEGGGPIWVFPGARRGGRELPCMDPCAALASGLSLSTINLNEASGSSRTGGEHDHHKPRQGSRRRLGGDVLHSFPRLPCLKAFFLGIISS